MVLKKDSSAALQAAPTSRTTQSHRKEKANNSMNVVFSKKVYFDASSSRHQSFPFQDSLINYITKNPSSSKCYQKMVQSCKYFYIKNPILVVFKFGYDEKRNDKCRIYSGKKCIQMANITSKLWITDELYVSCISPAKQNLFLSLIPKLYQFDAKRIYLWDHTLSFDHFCYLNQSTENIDLWRITVKYDDGSIVPFEKLIEALPKLKNIRFEPVKAVSNIASKTVGELVKMPHFSWIKYFNMSDVPETFDLNAFYIYMKKNQLTKFHLKFDDSISNAYKSRLEGIIDEIIATKTHDYKPPILHYRGLDGKKRDALLFL
uniref:Uncharacterized protein n=1 Tax=Panagrolaimus sp. ES5 TaxID=591445 RepID=A0AC34FW11_9BILA